MAKHLSKVEIVLLFLAVCTLWGCKKKEEGKMETQEELDKQIHIIEAKITEKIDMPDPEFNNFLTFRCTVTNPLDSPIPSGENIVFVISRGDIKKQNSTKTEIKAKQFNLGGIYRLAVTFAMPKGWDDLKEAFSDERVFIMACLQVEDVNTP
ncbi:MAG: hypothetical protein ACYTEE_10230 [Planctomycetota bacterium]|jgi:hypothetical protein